jgi:hypothetical protein
METTVRALGRPWATSPYVSCIRRDAPFHFFVLVYIVIAYALAIALDRPGKFLPVSGYMAVAGPVAMLAGVSLCAGVVPRRALVRPELVAGLLLFASLMLYVDAFAGVKSLLPDIVPFFADPWLARLDEVLHGEDPWAYVSSIIPDAVTPFLHAFYFIGWGIAVMCATFAALTTPRLQHLRAQYAWTFLIVWPLLGNIVAAAAMSGGPIFYDLITGKPEFHALMAHLGSAMHDYDELRRTAWSAHLGEIPTHGFAISAFPSLHVAMATLLALQAFHAGRRWFFAALALLAVILLGSVQLGWHYAVDGYFSIAATLLVWRSVGWVLRRTA